MAEFNQSIDRIIVRDKHVKRLIKGPVDHRVQKWAGRVISGSLFRRQKKEKESMIYFLPVRFSFEVAFQL